MALLKRSFKVYGKQDIQTKYLAFDGTNRKPPVLSDENTDLVLGKINPQKKCFPAGALVKFNTNKIMVPATAGDTVNNTSVFLLAEDVYASTYKSDGTTVEDLVDPGFVYWVVEDVNNLVEA